jgi:WD40 repeat protein
VAFSPDGKQLASASRNDTVRLWDTATGAALQTREVNTVIRTLLFSRDGSYLDKYNAYTDRSIVYMTIEVINPYEK